MFALALLNREQRVFEVGNLSNVGEDESEYLSCRVLSQHWHVTDHGALGFLAGGGIICLVAWANVDEVLESVGARGGAT